MIWEVSLLIFSISFLILVAFLLPTVLQVRRTAQRVESVSENLNQYLPGILGNLDEISENVARMMSYGRSQMEVLGTAVDEVKHMVDDIVHLEKDIRKRIEDPLVETLTTLTAIVKALRSFLDAIKSR